MGSKTRSAACARHRFSRCLMVKEPLHGDHGAYPPLGPPGRLRETAVEKAQHLERFLEGTQRADIVFSRDHAARDDGYVTCEISVVARRPCRPGPLERSCWRMLHWRRRSPRRSQRLTRMQDRLVQRSRPRHGAASQRRRSSRTESLQSPDPPRVVDRGTDRHRKDGARPRARRSPRTARAGLCGRHGRLPGARRGHRQAHGGRAQSRALAPHRHRRSLGGVLRRRLPG